MKNRCKKRILVIVCLLSMLCVSCSGTISDTVHKNQFEGKKSVVSLDAIPEYEGEPYVELNGNQPEFKKEELTTQAFETYSELDSLGRCQVAFANICKELMPTEERGSIGMIKPSGWHTVKYDCVEGKYLYNRCHLIGYQLAGENANEKNLITGTRYFNVEGMLPFEDQVADYVKETENHVLYRVKPVYDGSNLVAKGVEIEAYSVEDEGDGISFHVFVYNVQPGIQIDYANGESVQKKEQEKQETGKQGELYIINENTKKFHKKTCSSVPEIQNKNKSQYKGEKNQLIERGYSPCKKCNP